MSMRTVTIEIPEESLAVIDEIAANMEVDRATALREAIASYLADYVQLNKDIDEAEGHIRAGNFSTQEEVEARFETRIQRTKAA